MIKKKSAFFLSKLFKFLLVKFPLHYLMFPALVLCGDFPCVALFNCLKNSSKISSGAFVMNFS